MPNMIFIEQIINCTQHNDYKNSKRSTPFTIARSTLNYVSNPNHKTFIDKIIGKGKVLAQKVNPAAANYSTKTRKKERLINNATAGLLAEYAWKQYINQKAGTKVVDYTEFTDAATQIDLYVISNNKLIEVRSSFPQNGLVFAICHATFEFDILGPYSNTVKPGEIQKDFYTRTLYHIPKNTSFMELLKKDNFKVYLTGGATWDMMTNTDVSKNKDLLPQDAVTIAEEEKSTYRVVPFSKALDTDKIFDLINPNN